MPQVDLETLVTACAGAVASCDGKVADRDSDSSSEGEGSEIPLPDYAPESFWLSKDAEYDWFDRNAFLERNESINSHLANLNLNVHPPPLHLVSNSKRLSVNRKSKASIIRLPKTQKTTFAEAKNRKNGKPSGNTRLFPNKNKTGSTVLKPDPAVIEPGSPKVSCMGRVRSKRDRNRRRRTRNKQTEPIRPGKDRSDRSERSGLFASFRAMFRTRRRRRSGRKDGNALAAQAEESVRIVRDIRERLPEREAEALRKTVGERNGGDGAGDAPSLGGMKRFASGRKSDTWVGDVA